MPIVTDTLVDGFVTCGRPRTDFPDDCPGYESEPCKVIRQVVSFSYLENGADPGVPGMDVNMIEREVEHIKPADDDWTCRHCGEAANFSLTPRVDYPHVSDQSPDELVKRARRQVAADERSASALEKLVTQGDQSARVAQLEELVTKLMAKMGDGGAGE